MPKIILETYLNAPIQRCFDLARSIDLHQDSNVSSKERAVAGRTHGLIELGDTVTWEARHLGIKQRLTVEVIELKSPFMFKDVMLKGAFKYMAHEHAFEETDSGTMMIDRFEFTSPLGILGKLVNALFLKRYMTNFLIHKNGIYKKVVEGDQWRKYLSAENNVDP